MMLSVTDAAVCVRCHGTEAQSRRLAGQPYCLRCCRTLVSDRGLAFCVEAFLPIAVLNLLLTRSSTTNPYPGQQGLMVLAAATYLIWLGYFLTKDALRDGQSLGKRWRHLKVVGETGEPCRRRQSLVRNVILVIPFVMWIEVLLVLFRPDGRRLGDLLAKTWVVDASHGLAPVQPGESG